MIKPLFAKARDRERTLTQAAQAGTKTLHVSAPSEFALGDRIFVSESDGSELEYLGPVTQIGADSLTVTHALANPKTITARIWRPQSAFQWDTVTTEPVERVFHEGIAVERSVGGALWAVRLADPIREDTLRFTGVSRAAFASFRSWLSSHACGGLDDFTWVDEQRACARVRLLNCDFIQLEKVPRVVALDIRLAVLGEGAYA
jgi:hypothetical protein